MTLRFDAIQVWQQSLALAGEIDLQARLFPRMELFNQTAQIKRAADSVVLHIAEGNTTQPVWAWKYFLGKALRSAMEVRSCLFIARSSHYLAEEDFNRLQQSYSQLCCLIATLHDGL